MLVDARRPGRRLLGIGEVQVALPLPPWCQRFECGREGRISVQALPELLDLDEYVPRSLKGGARGFLLKYAGPELLAQADRVAAGGDALIAPSVTARLLEAFADSTGGATRTAAGAIGMLTLESPRRLLRHGRFDRWPADAPMSTRPPR